MDKKTFKTVIQNLEMLFGEPELPHKSDILTMLVKIILSQATTGVNSRLTFQNLIKTFKNWDEVLKAEEEKIAEAIKLGGLANQKAKVIKNLLFEIRKVHDELSLNFVEKMSDEEAKKFLQGFKGVGPKTAACTLLFAAHKEVFPLDTHIFRIFKRMGVLPEKITDKQAHKLLDKIVPSGKFYSLHINLIKLGKKICRPQNPLCYECPLIEHCDYGSTKL